jgi:hypothetical protein
LTSIVSGVIAASGAMGWILAYLRFNDTALALATSVSQSPVVVLFVLRR